ncbi:hypothetical protein V5F23_09875 [Pseudomonas sp. WP18]|uniref:Uncharacterized protein n=1 Tax=Pseudomonas brassicacearum TaxID=930166 RepID=A0A423GDH5_9PSED|nr:hypothetical protein [Pseudomonas brassicacearum]ROM84882.1 hypothetical protein BK652_09890 [Pseudomonas brassicacearum]
MNQPWVLNDDGSVSILNSQMIASGMGISLPDDWSSKQQEKADLLERRLRRIELALGIDATPESTAALEAALSQL